MRIVEADLDPLAVRMPPGWAAVKDPEAFRGDLFTRGRLLPFQERGPPILPRSDRR